MEHDRFATNVQQLISRHQGQLAPGLIAEIALQRWLALRSRYADPFDPALFARIDEVLTAMTMPGSVKPRPPETVATESAAAPRRRQRSGRAVVDRPVSRFR